MEATVYEEFGGPEVLRHTSGLAVPQPGPGEVRVKVAAVGVNPVDWKRRYGWVEEFYPTTFPAVPGLEFAGTVDQLGEGVTGLAVGDEVLGWTKTGAYAEYAIADIVVPKPAGLPWGIAASLPVAGETAQRVLDLLGVRAGETLFLHGAAGVVGSVGVQLAVAAGVTVIGSASESNHAYLRELGAIPVAYGEGLADRVRAAAPDGVHAVFDAAGHGVLPVAIELLGGGDAAKKRIVTIADVDAEKYGITFSGVIGEADAVRAGLTEHARGAAAGTLKVRLAETLPLKEAARAQELSESGHARGKLILIP
ncbi:MULTISPECIES: NADP-dependent oxidoreductase [Streptomyces]|uniref:Quinone oxidoreductase n=1 Tax=Streptomyces venezuelae (strain ATCC 10712 / CBS 650.69 / DSM 40230 / JCM 4526 / NBRC 13096 / PD 04745) TaxID=953739 RepID=F2RA93_STRVP|nr:NADP-dependent oxidoreductase [Streptomyces venezuelae]APE26312.1 NADPH:quinone reductase [Streptomyces venezuelae]QES03685.1 NADP-dependent oxidoreductase [Streptomyces venezuelae ATCC 10712]CCA56575.1 Quinone oxidoreductase [Streptomyces venezuelae ATCC 10712]